MPDGTSDPMTHPELGAPPCTVCNGDPVGCSECGRLYYLGAPHPEGSRPPDPVRMTRMYLDTAIEILEAADYRRDHGGEDLTDEENQDAYEALLLARQLVTSHMLAQPEAGRPPDHWTKLPKGWERDYKCLAEAVNDMPATCDDQCDSYGHSEACGAKEARRPAEAIVRLQDEIAVLRAAQPESGRPPTCEHECECSSMEDVVREVLCRVFEDGAGRGMEEWREWYKPKDWLWWGRGLGAFIYRRHKRLADLSGRPPGEMGASPQQERADGYRLACLALQEKLPRRYDTDDEFHDAVDAVIFWQKRDFPRSASPEATFDNCDLKPEDGHSQQHDAGCRSFQSAATCQCGRPLYDGHIEALRSASNVGQAPSDGQRIANCFQRLLALPDNWDSYGAPKIDPATVERARAWLDGGNVVPCSDGGVQLEWHSEGVDVEVTFRADGSTETFGAPVGGEAPSEPCPRCQHPESCASGDLVCVQPYFVEQDATKRIEALLTRHLSIARDGDGTLWIADMDEAAKAVLSELGAPSLSGDGPPKLLDNEAELERRYGRSDGRGPVPVAPEGEDEVPVSAGGTRNLDEIRSEHRQKARHPNAGDGPREEPLQLDADVMARFKREWRSLSPDWREGYLAALSGVNQPSWRCFHCDTVLTDRDEARVHFGQGEADTPQCLRDVLGLLRSDAFAVSFQTLGQYRTALLEALAGKLPLVRAAVPPAPEEPTEPLIVEPGHRDASSYSPHIPQGHELRAGVIRPAEGGPTDEDMGALRRAASTVLYWIESDHQRKFVPTDLVARLRAALRSLPNDTAGPAGEER